ncbi:MAG: general secretion pathway protein GspB [Thermoanaerobaculum sp.]|nr:general secretion pathway protein GspB [Thermoanaerobaculum sp.]
MSLITEALRKARAERQRQEALAGQLPPPVSPAPAAPTKVGAGVWFLSLLSGVAGALLVLLFWPEKTPPSPPHSPAPQSQMRVTVPTQPPLPLPTATPRSLNAASRATPSLPSAVAHQQDQPSPSHPSPEATPPTEREFVVEARLGGTTLHLDYLVFGASRSFASINGQEVRVGDFVAGFSVVAIGEDRVVLQAGKQRVILKVR